MLTPFVSVIIPNYNHAEYLDQRIQSVLNQTYQYFEVIILDDKSTDNSREVIEKYRGNPRISHIEYNEVNSGSTFKQWHKGFELVKGDLIWIAESDDYCESYFLENMIEQYLNHSNDNVSFVFCVSNFVDENGNYLLKYPHINSSYVKYDSREFIRNFMARGTVVVNASAVLFSKKHAQAINRQYESFKATGDSLFWIEMAEIGNVVCLRDAMNYFRQHNNKVSPRKILDGTTYSERHLIYRYLCNNGYLSFGDKIETLYYYYSKLYTTKFNNEIIRKSLLKTWSPYNIPHNIVYKFVVIMMLLKNRVSGIISVNSK